jgi:outer membrane biosynthesis protein TonB
MMKPKITHLRLPFQDHEDRDFMLALIGSLIFYTSLVLLIHVIKVPENPREDFKRIPPHIAKLILEAPKTIPLPNAQTSTQKTVTIPKAQETPAPEAAPKQDTKKATDQKAKQQEEPMVQAPPPPPSQEEVRLRLEQEARATQQRNRAVAMQSGLLRLLTKESKTPSAVKDLTEGKDLEKVFSTTSGLEQIQQPSRTQKVEASKVIKGTGSGGIDNLIAALKEQGSDGTIGGIGERQATKVESPIEIKGSGGEEATRSYESIVEVVDSIKGWIRFVYNRSLRENPALKGIITLEFDINPSGDVTSCRVISSTMKNPVLEDQLVKRFLQLKFPPVPNGINTVIYPITLVPSG